MFETLVITIVGLMKGIDNDDGSDQWLDTDSVARQTSEPIYCLALLLSLAEEAYMAWINGICFILLLSPRMLSCWIIACLVKKSMVSYGNLLNIRRTRVGSHFYFEYFL